MPSIDRETAIALLDVQPARVVAMTLAQARDKVRAAVAEMARAVGLEVVGG